MAGFFSLGSRTRTGTGTGSSSNNNCPRNNNTNENSRNNEQNKATSSGLWQHLPYSPGVELGVAPTDTRGDETTRSGHNFMMMRMSSSSGGTSGSNISCQDCGNQAKKDCLYMRCRTCCKSRGFDCATHVKSTWVPASVRRERHHNLLQQPPQQQEQYLGVTNPKRSRKDNSSSSSLVCTTNATNTISFSGMEEGNFPAELSSSAVFRCVRVSSIDDTDDEYAYQTAVNIGGHVFKGILYDQGPDSSQQGSTPSPSYAPGGESSSAGNLTAGFNASIAGTTPVSAIPSSSSSPAIGYLDPSFYLPLNTYLSPGTPFFPNPRP